MSGVNLTEAQFRELQGNLGRADSAVGPRPLSSGSRKAKPEPFAGPVDVTLNLWGHCPSKKNLWKPGLNGQMFLDSDVKQQIDLLTMQALHGWRIEGPVDHPELTIKFFVNAQRRDRDGMFVTVLDCLQSAGVMVNDNLAHNNARTVLEPAEFVGLSDERVEIRVVKR